MKGPQLDVKWDLGGVFASHNFLEKTVIAVLVDTITTLSASVSFFVFFYHIWHSVPPACGCNYRLSLTGCRDKPPSLLRFKYFFSVFCPVLRLT